MFFIVDYENTHQEGLSGILSLPRGDEVIIVYTQNVPSVPFLCVEEFLSSPAKIKLLKANSGDQVADKVIIALASKIACENPDEIISIVSKDKGFRYPLSFVSKRVSFNPTVKAAATTVRNELTRCAKAEKARLKKYIEDSLAAHGLKGCDANLILETISASNNKALFAEKMKAEYGRKSARIISDIINSANIEKEVPKFNKEETEEKAGE